MTGSSDHAGQARKPHREHRNPGRRTIRLPNISPAHTPAATLRHRRSRYRLPAAPAAPKNGLGIASLVLAVIALVSVATVFAPIVLGHRRGGLGFLGRGRVKRGTANNGGVAIAGIVLGGLAIIVGLAFIAIWTTVWKDVRRRRLHRLHAEGRLQPRPAAAVRRQFRQNIARPVERHVDAAPVP